MSKLYLITRNDYIDYDEYAGYVIAAETENEARLIAANNHADEGGEIWTSEPTATVTLIAKESDQEVGIVLESMQN